MTLKLIKNKTKKTTNSRKMITNISFFVINQPKKQIIELDLSTIVTSVSGPKRPHDRVAVSNMQEDFRSCLTNKVRAKCHFSFICDKIDELVFLCDKQSPVMD